MKPNEAFDAAFQFTVEVEGGYVVDQGGPTNHGVTQTTYSKWLKKHGRPDAPVTAIAAEDVRAIYRSIYWDEVNLEQLADHVSPLLAIAVFDTAINAGEGRAVKLLQKIVCPDDIDGELGPHTLGLARKAMTIDGKDVVDLYLKERWDFYQRLADKDKSYKKDLHGYHNRVLKLESFINGLKPTSEEVPA